EAGQAQQQAAPEGPRPPPPLPRFPPGPGRARPLSRRAPDQKGLRRLFVIWHGYGQLPPKLRCRPGSVKVPAVVSQVCWTRFLIVIVAACSPTPPVAPAVPGVAVSVPASWPIVMPWKVAELPARELASTIRLVADTGVLPPAVSRRVSGPAFP